MSYISLYNHISFNRVSKHKCIIECIRRAALPALIEDVVSPHIVNFEEAASLDIPESRHVDDPLRRRSVSMCR